MIFRRTEHFRKAFSALPVEIQTKVFKAFVLFKTDISHPSLGVNKIQGFEGVWEGRIDQSYRFTFHFEKDDENGETICVFRNVDNHDEWLKNP